MVETAIVAKDMFGGQLYQSRARAALPILVRQALSKNPIYYSELAAELKIPNARNLNYVLGSIGTTLNDLNSDRMWGEIPHIESLVINHRHGLPGEGFDVFLKGKVGGYRELSASERQEYLRVYWGEIYAFPFWFEVLDRCGLPSVNDEAPSVFSGVKKAGSGGGEGEAHRALKEYVAANPRVVGLPASSARGELEFDLLSGDKVDVVFRNEHRVTAVEVKSHISNSNDVERGLYQCVKYRAVLEAMAGFAGERCAVDAVLALELSLPEVLRPLKHSLGVKVIEVKRPR